MNGNLTYRHANTAILAVAAVEAPRVVTSDSFDERLAGTLSRLGLRPGLLQGLAGIHERRWWPEGHDVRRRRRDRRREGARRGRHRPGRRSA